MLFVDFQRTPEACMGAFHLKRTQFEMIVERKLRRGLPESSAGMLAASPRQSLPEHAFRFLI